MVVKKVKKTTSLKPPAKKKIVKKKTAIRSSKSSRSTLSSAPSKSKIKFTLALKGRKEKTSNTHLSNEKEIAQATLQPRFAFQDNYSLPNNYNVSNLTLIARDPYWIYAYWEISPASIDELRKQIGDQVNHATYVLRLFEISYVDFNGYNANHSFDIDIGPFTNSWYINLMSDNGAYCAELGLRTHDGKFHKITRSNYITTPRAVGSPRSDLIWMEVKENENPDAYIELKSKKGLKRTNQQGVRIRRIYLTDAEIAAYYARHFSLLKSILSHRLSSQELEEINNSPEGFGIFGSLSIDEVLQGRFTHRQFLRKIRSGSSEEMIVEEGASVRETIKKRGFFFEIGTELIVYGRTEPDAKVTLEGKEVKLRADGTFSLRYILNDTRIPLGFKAFSSNGIDKRSITTAVGRFKTVYQDNA